MPARINPVRVSLARTMDDAVRRLPPHVIPEYVSFLTKFMMDPTSPGLNYERINAIQPNLRSARITQQYRAIILDAEQNGSHVYSLLWVDKHDDAYDWARRKRIAVDEESAVITMYDVVETPLEEQNGGRHGWGVGAPEQVEQLHQSALGDAADDIQSRYGDEVLLSLGIPAENMILLRHIRTEDDLAGFRPFFPEIVYERLLLLMAGFDAAEVRCHGTELLGMTPESADAIPNEAGANKNLSLLEAMLLPQNQSQFYMAMPGEAGVDPVFQAIGKIDAWRVFLHPIQQQIVEAHYSGPVRISGAAGTGKTVVAVHRARYLAERIFCEPSQKILVTTFTTTLADDLTTILQTLCTADVFSRITICSLESWMSQWLSRQGRPERLVFGQEVESLWLQAKEQSNLAEDFPVRFYMQEYEKVIAAGKITSLAQYLHASRQGRGTPLNRARKSVVWNVIENYRRLLVQKGVWDSATAAMFIEEVFRQRAIDGVAKAEFDAIVMDEAQDFGAAWLRMVRAMAGEQHDDDLFLVGDANQRIYGRKVVLKDCGIHVAGRSGVLRINYRTTAAIAACAEKMLDASRVADETHEIEDTATSVALVKGKPVEMIQCSQTDKESELVLSTVHRWKALLVEDDSICIMARSSRALDGIRQYFERKGVRTYEIKNRKEDRALGGVRFCTLHRAKGLEFDCVAITGINAGAVPPNVALQAALDAVERNEVMEMEKALLYTAMTRARKELLVTCAGRASELVTGWKMM